MSSWKLFICISKMWRSHSSVWTNLAFTMVPLTCTASNKLIIVRRFLIFIRRWLGRIRLISRINNSSWATLRCLRSLWKWDSRGKILAMWRHRSRSCNICWRRQKRQTKRSFRLAKTCFGACRHQIMCLLSRPMQSWLQVIWPSILIRISNNSHTERILRLVSI